MRKQVEVIALVLIILSILSSCKKDDPNDILVEIKLTDEFGATTSQFTQSDSLIFEFHLANHTGIEATYLRPCHEFGEYLNIYRKDDEGNYVFYGRPEYNCADVAVYLGISEYETILLGRIPWNTERGWPELELGSYYVGDTLSLMINDKMHDFYERIYFKIQ
jgi:hypothetical protein